MNDRERKLVESCITEAKQQREDALNKAKIALEEAFPERNVTITKKVAEDGVTTEDLDGMIDELAVSADTGSIEQENTQPSFFQNLSHSLNRKTINGRNTFKNRFRLLAGIKTSPAVARLTIKEGVVVDLMEIPKWYDVIRYKLCGFKYEVLVEQL